MPLSKKRNRERMKQLRVQPKPVSPVRPIVQPSVLDVVSPSVRQEGYGKASVQPIIEQVKLLYPDGKLPNCPDGRYRG